MLLRNRIDYPFVAIVIGPLLILAAFIFIGYRYRQSYAILQEHIARINERDLRWEPILREIHQYGVTSKEFIELHLDRQDSDTAKMLEQQKEIIKKQEELWTLIQSKKVGELQSSVFRTQPSAEVTCEWIVSSKSDVAD